MVKVEYTELEKALDTARTTDFLQHGTVNVRVQKAKTEMLCEFKDVVDEYSSFGLENGFFILKGNGCYLRLPATDPEGRHPIFMNEETEIKNPQKMPYTRAKYFLFFAGRTRTVIEFYSI